MFLKVCFISCPTLSWPRSAVTRDRNVTAKGKWDVFFHFTLHHNSPRSPSIQTLDFLGSYDFVTLKRTVLYTPFHSTHCNACSFPPGYYTTCSLHFFSYKVVKWHRGGGGETNIKSEIRWKWRIEVKLNVGMICVFSSSYMVTRWWGYFVSARHFEILVSGESPWRLVECL